MGYAGNVVPQFILPTLIGTPQQKAGETTQNIRNSEGLNDLDFFIGNEGMCDVVVDLFVYTCVYVFGGGL